MKEVRIRDLNFEVGTGLHGRTALEGRSAAAVGPVVEAEASRLSERGFSHRFVYSLKQI